MARAVVIATLFSFGLLACGSPDLTVDAYSDPVTVDLGSLPVDGGVFTFMVTIANTGTGDGEITGLELAGDDLSFVEVGLADTLPLELAANQVVQVPLTVTNLESLPDGWFEQVLELNVTLDSTWQSGGCGGGAAADSDSLVVPITFAVPDACDADDDGFRSLLCGGDDCDDTLASVYPGATEVCDFEDNDCNGQVDGDDAVDATSWYADGDGDGYGFGTATMGCVAPAVGYVALGGDCSDDNPAVSPGATEICNDIDDDCDSQVDDDDNSLDTTTGDEFWTDRDGDGFGNPADSTFACEAPIGHVDRAGDCDDVLRFVNPDADEMCDGEHDEDCDGTVDEATAVDATRFYADRDGDGYGNPASSQLACSAPIGHVTDNTDCDDVLRFVHPDADETCNNTDDDCDNVVDEDAGDFQYPDRDADGYGSDTGAFQSCGGLTVGHVLVGGDCNDSSFRFNPGVDDPCDDPRDLNCDGLPENGCSSCLAILESGGTPADGLYDLDVDADGDGTPDTTVETWCDMTTDGGGWTLAQRTVWDWSESQQLLTGFGEWAATPVGAASPGSVYRYPGAQWENISSQGDLLAVHRVRTVNDGACEPLYYEGTGGALIVDVVSSSATFTGLSSSVRLASESLTTTDSGPSARCTEWPSQGVPWFYDNCCATCPTFRSGFWSDEAHPTANYLGDSPDLFGRVAADVCTDTPRPAENGTAFIGVDSMELYFR